MPHGVPQHAGCSRASRRLGCSSSPDVIQTYTAGGWIELTRLSSTCVQPSWTSTSTRCRIGLLKPTHPRCPFQQSYINIVHQLLRAPNYRATQEYYAAHDEPQERYLNFPSVMTCWPRPTPVCWFLLTPVCWSPTLTCWPRLTLTCWSLSLTSAPRPSPASWPSNRQLLAPIPRQ